MTAQNIKLNRGTALLLVIDVQERLAAAMPQDAMARVARATQTLVRGAGVLGVPVILTEQYPKGLGRTLASVGEALPGSARVFEKTSFSCWDSPEVHRAIHGAHRNQVIVCGMETHVCVYQTVRDLALEGFETLVAVDAVLSRTDENKAIGLGMMAGAGAVLGSVEAVLFDLLGQAGTPEFKAISQLVK